MKKCEYSGLPLTASRIMNLAVANWTVQFCNNVNRRCEKPEHGWSVCEQNGDDDRYVFTNWYKLSSRSLWEPVESDSPSYRNIASRIHASMGIHSVSTGSLPNWIFRFLPQYHRDHCYVQRYPGECCGSLQFHSGKLFFRWIGRRI